MSRYKQPYSLYKRGKYWYYRTYDNKGIRTVAKSTGCTSKALAREQLDQLFKAGTLWSSSQSFESYALHFFDDNSHFVKDRVKPLAENTLRGYRIKLNQYLLPNLKGIALKDISYSRLKDLRIWMLERYSVSNTISTMSTLKLIIDAAYRDRLILENPFSFLEPLSLKQNTRDAFTLDEVIELYHSISDEFKNIILLMSLTGMRISEAVGIREDDILQGKGFLFIDLKKQFNLNKYKALKTGEVRQIPIIEELQSCIGFPPTRLSAFYREYNKIKKQFKDVDKRQLSFHSLRHFFITNAKSEGIPEIKVETIAGHSLKGISKVYTNFKVDDLLEILEWQKSTYKKIKDSPKLKSPLN